MITDHQPRMLHAMIRVRDLPRMLAFLLRGTRHA